MEVAAWDGQKGDTGVIAHGRYTSPEETRSGQKEAVGDWEMMRTCAEDRVRRSGGILAWE